MPQGNVGQKTDTGRNASPSLESERLTSASRRRNKSLSPPGISPGGVKADTRLYVLKGQHPKQGEIVSYFTHQEKDTALEIARSWYDKDWKPALFSKTYKGDFKFWFDWRKQKPQKPKRKVA